MALDGARIYTGPWIDWSRGPVLGSTITLSATNGAVLTAFLSFFVTLVGAAIWRLLSYLIHQLSATADASDGMHHQHQVIFRNTSAPSEAAIAFASNAWAWRKNGTRSWARSIPLALFAILFMVGFGIASILTSQVTKGAGEARLIVSDHCGFFAYDGNSDVGTRTRAQGVKDLNDTLSAAAYARTCYNGASASANLLCSSYLKPSLAWKANANADCPFASKMCTTKAYSMDTGMLDSHEDLGINMPSSGRMKFRKVTTCAPLTSMGYVKVVNATLQNLLGAPGDRIRQYQYGGIGPGAIDNVTYSYNQHTILDGFGYQLDAVLQDDSGMWKPIPELARKDADVTLMFLSGNSMRFDKPNNDSWFHANYEVPGEVIGGIDTTFYMMDEWVSVMGCADQYQYCDQDGNHCTPLTNHYDAALALNATGVSVLQNWVAARIALNSRALSMYYSVFSRGATALKAQETVQERDQGPIPNNQWQIELSGWFAVSMARLQKAIVDYAAGPNFVPAGTYVEKPTSPSPLAMCYSQKVATTDETISFSVLGMAIILIVGTFFILLNLIIEAIITRVQKRYQWGDYRRVRWVMDDKMQLQRMAFEEAGMGSWDKLTDSHPVTAPGQRFGELSHVDFNQPRLGTKWTRKEYEANYASGNESQYQQFSDMENLEIQQEIENQKMKVAEQTKKGDVNITTEPVYKPITPPANSPRLEAQK